MLTILRYLFQNTDYLNVKTMIYLLIQSFNTVFNKRKNVFLNFFFNYMTFCSDQFFVEYAGCKISSGYHNTVYGLNPYSPVIGPYTLHIRTKIQLILYRYIPYSG